MSSPGARQRRRRQQYQTPRTRAELATAVGASVAIVVGTALMIWLLRPGGIADRQPRSSWLVGLVVIAGAVLTFEILRPKSPIKMSRRVSFGGGFGIILVLAVIAGFAWPHGLIRHTPTLATFPTVPTNQSTAAPGSTVAPGSTAAPGSTTAPQSTTSGRPTSASSSP